MWQRSRRPVQVLRGAGAYLREGVRLARPRMAGGIITDDGPDAVDASRLCAFSWISGEIVPRLLPRR
jgi:hypothetical protein